MSSSHSHTPPVTPQAATARRRHTLLVAAMIGAILVIGARIAAACIPWTGKLEVENLAHGDQDGDGTDE